MKYRCVDTCFEGFDPVAEDLRDVKTIPVKVLNTEVFREIIPEAGRFIMGEMICRETGSRSRALFVCAADDPQDTDNRTGRITFRVPGYRVSVYTGNEVTELTPEAGGRYTVSLPSCSGALITAE